jgi:lysylphosphatidylglycerol synthetase-like protein (DUF2156 family)
MFGTTITEVESVELVAAAVLEEVVVEVLVVMATRLLYLVLLQIGIAKTQVQLWEEEVVVVMWIHVVKSGACFQTEESAQAALAAITKTELFGVNYIVGATSDGTNDTIYRPNSPVVQLCNYNNLLVLPVGEQHVEYSAYFFGWNHKRKSEALWKWKSINFSHFGISDGAVPTCYSADISGGASVMITSPTIATAQIHFHIEFKVSCLFNIGIVRPDDIDRVVRLDANSI